MSEAPAKTFGFEYTHGGRTFGFFVDETCAETAKQHVAAIANAVFVGELKVADQCAAAASSSTVAPEPVEGDS